MGIEFVVSGKWESGLSGRGKMGSQNGSGGEPKTDLAGNFRKL